MNTSTVFVSLLIYCMPTLFVLAMITACYFLAATNRVGKTQ